MSPTAVCLDELKPKRYFGAIENGRQQDTDTDMVLCIYYVDTGAGSRTMILEIKLRFASQACGNFSDKTWGNLIVAGNCCVG